MSKEKNNWKFIKADSEYMQKIPAWKNGIRVRKIAEVSYQPHKSKPTAIEKWLKSVKTEVV